MRIRLMSVALSSLLLLPAIAKADTFTFSSTGSVGFTGTGLLTATNNGNGSYTVTGISGTGITGLLAPGVFLNDNLLFPGASRLLDVNGIGFATLVGGVAYQVDIFSTVSGYEAFTQDTKGNFGDDTVTFSAASTTSAVPEPSSLMLMGSGVLAIAAGLRRRFVG